LKAECQACTGPYFNNTVYCVDGNLIPNYNNATSACSSSSTLQFDPYYGQAAACVCSIGTHYTNGTTCVACDSSAPGGNTSCATCAIASKYYATTLGCIYCPNLIGSTGIPDPYGNGCGCQSGYYWNIATSTCDCDWWNNLVGGPIASCIDCGSILGTTSIASAAGCGCTSGWWNALTFACQLSCDLTYDIIVGVNCYSCSSVSFSTGPILNNTVCGCTAPYQWYWNSTSMSGTCICNTTFSAIISGGGCVNCSALTYGTGVVTNKVCACLTGFSWSISLATCICPSTYTLNRNAKTCVCPTSTSAVISGVCVNCKSLTHCTGPNSNYTTCVCTTPYQWTWNSTSLTGACICNPSFEITTSTSPNCLNCNSLSYTKGTVTNNTCDCNTNFLWNTTSLTCYCPYTWTTIGTTCVCPTGTSAVIGGLCVDCSSISNHLAPGPNGDNTICVCTYPYQWSWTNPTGQCLCNLPSEITITDAPRCLDCRDVTYATGKVSNVTADTCECNLNFLWNATSN
jgi:hypothetical protein